MADCILLFSMNKPEAFPVDTWIKKVMSEIYTDSTNISKIGDFAIKKVWTIWGNSSTISFLL